MEGTQKRRYVSDLRREHAEATRLRIAEAARTLMIERGYAATTMGDVAAAAGVAVQTLYAACPGGKPGLVKIVYDVTLAGDGREVPQGGRPPVLAIIEEPDPVRKLALYAAMAVTIFGRIGPIHRVLRAAAAAGGTGIGDLLDETERQRRNGSRQLTQHLAEAGALRPGLTADRAADEVFALTSIEVYERLTDVCEWTVDEYEDWLARTLAGTLLSS